MSKSSTPENKGEYIQIRIAPSEKEAFNDAADIAGIPLSAWIRERLRRVAIRELENAGRSVPFIRSIQTGGNQ